MGEVTFGMASGSWPVSVTVFGLRCRGIAESFDARRGGADAVVAVPHARLLVAEPLGQRFAEGEEYGLQVDGRAFAKRLGAGRRDTHAGDDERGGIARVSCGPPQNGRPSHGVAGEDRALDAHDGQEALELIRAVGFVLVARGVLGVAVVDAVIGVDVVAVAEVGELLPPGLGTGAVAVEEDERWAIRVGRPRCSRCRIR
ncbi:MAG: hypothetical protein U5Q44_16125 [Dehalococcoidia bacterium]|nr:hypothetical protein [Dehalococcoidia bacterium]